MFETKYFPVLIIKDVTWIWWVGGTVVLIKFISTILTINYMYQKYFHKYMV